MLQISYIRRSSAWVFTVIGLFALACSLHGGVERDALLLFGLCFGCELIDSGLGMGYGTILTPVLLLMGYEPIDIVPTVLLSELLSGFTAAFFHHQIRNVDLRRAGADLRPALLLALGSVLGVTAGVLLAMRLPADLLRMAIGCIILLSGLFVVLLSRKVVEYRTWKMLGIAGLASFNKAVSGGGYGPLVTSGQILSGVRGRSAVGITSFAEGFTCLAAVALFLAKGNIINLGLFIPMCAGALVSVPFSVLAVNKANEGHLKVLIGALTMVMGILLISKAIAGG